MKEKKILLVDFDNNSLNSLKEFLQSKGYQILTARDGETAYNKCKSEKPELVIMEPMIPKVHGFELCTMIVKEFDGKIPVVILTQFYKEEQFKREAIYSFGASAFLRKPFKKEEVLQVLHNILGPELTEQHDLEKKEQTKKPEPSKKADIVFKADEDIEKKLQDVLSIEEIKSSKKTIPHEIDNEVDEMLKETLSKFKKPDFKKKSASDEEEPEDILYSFEDFLKSSKKTEEEGKIIAETHEHEEKKEDEQESKIFKEFDFSKQKKSKTIFKNKTIIATFVAIVSIAFIAIIFTQFFKGNPSKKLASLPLGTGFIELEEQKKIDYEGVSITIDDSPVLLDTTEPKEIQAGTHELKVKKGDKVFTKKIKIVEGKTNKISIPIVPLTIDIQPDGEIWEEDNLIKEINRSHILYLLPMEYTFIFKKDDYQDEIKTIKLDENSSLASIQIQLNRLIPTEPGALSIQLLPSGKVYEGENFLASFPPFRQNIRLSPGQHTLKFTSSEEGCKDQIKTFQIISGKIENVKIYLCFGYLNINSTPAGATIIIDNNRTDLEGKAYGMTPRARIKLPTGLHTLLIKHPDYPEKTGQFGIKNNETTNISFDLKAK
ncbi:MAG: response regulator [Candidatus Aminicenantes bacterium]|nr:response regulator [Candidatus Aminicenantes bacterium]